VAQFILGWFHRSLRAPLLNGYMARRPALLSDEARCGEAKRILVALPVSTGSLWESRILRPRRPASTLLSEDGNRKRIARAPCTGCVWVSDLHRHGAELAINFPRATQWPPSVKVKLHRMPHRYPTGYVKLVSTTVAPGIL
jgi:hypothetical protein